MLVYKDIKFTTKEFLSLIITNLITGFAISIFDWGYETFSLRIGLINLFRAFFVSLAITTLSIILCKYLSSILGMYLQVEFNTLASLIGFVFFYIFYGLIPIPGFFKLIFSSDEKIRFGQKRKMFLFSDSEKISLAYLYFVFILCFLWFLAFKDSYAVKLALAHFFYVLPIPHVPGFYALINGKKSVRNIILNYLILLIIFIVLLSI
ncbi:MAG: hypothetical protein QXD62_00950 [Candidatus Woesearchaeota archaeon]